MFVRKLMADVNTRHITRKDADLLDYVSNNQEDSMLTVLTYEYGWLIHVSGLSKPISSDIIDGLKRLGFSADFIELILVVDGNKMQWLNLDCDGEVYDKLRSHVW